MKQQYLECGKIVGTHGINGTLKVNPLCDGADFLTNFKSFYLNKNGENPLSVNFVKVHKNIALISVKGISSIEKAQEFIGKTIYLNRNDANLNQGQFFIKDLLGLNVYNKSGKLLGKLTDISTTGANDVWHITQEKTEYLVPYIKDIEANVDLEKGIITINPLKGIFNDED